MKLSKKIMEMIEDSAREIFETEVKEGLPSSQDKRQQAIAYVIHDEKFSDKDLKNLYVMVKGDKPANFQSAKKILDKIQYRVKYLVDGWGLQDVKNVLDNMGISEAGPKIVLDYMAIEQLAQKSAGSSSDPKSVYAAIEQIASSRKLGPKQKKDVYELVAKYKQAKSDSEKSKIEAAYEKILGVNESTADVADIKVWGRLGNKLYAFKELKVMHPEVMRIMDKLDQSFMNKFGVYTINNSAQAKVFHDNSTGLARRSDAHGVIDVTKEADLKKSVDDIIEEGSGNPLTQVDSKADNKAKLDKAMASIEKQFGKK